MGHIECLGRQFHIFENEIYKHGICETRFRVQSSFMRFMLMELQQEMDACGQVIRFLR